VRIRVPPLRERLEDLPLLVRGILDGLGGKALGFGLSDELLARLRAHSWPGNVRELKNLIERGVALGDFSAPDARQTDPGDEPQFDYHQAREDALSSFERDFVVHLLRTFDGTVAKAARAAGIDRVYLHKLIKKHGIDVERP
jgi:two-component system nitrogen regulation response regulator GlnG